MATTYIVAGLYAWTLTLESGAVRRLLAPTLDGAIRGMLPSPVVSAVRGAAVDPAAPAPAIASLVPPSAQLGAANFTLRVLGTNFRDGDTILWNGAPVTTTFVSATEVTTPINMTGAAVMPVPVIVRSLTGQESAAATFNLLAAGELEPGGTDAPPAPSPCAGSGDVR